VRHWVVGLVAGLSVATVGVRARADSQLRIETVEERTWPAAVAALQRDMKSEGRVIHVAVREADGTRVKGEAAVPLVATPDAEIPAPAHG
jgi:hypothetical protein